MSVMAIWLFIAAVLQTRKSERPAVNFLKLRNPGRAQTSFAVRFAARPYHLGSHAMRDWLGEAGIYLLAGVSGLADVDAITISMARLGVGEISIHSAALAVLAATVVNTLTKASSPW